MAAKFISQGYPIVLELLLISDRNHTTLREKIPISKLPFPMKNLIYEVKACVPKQ
jgi:hypothetical protein